MKMKTNVQGSVDLIESFHFKVFLVYQSIVKKNGLQWYEQILKNMYFFIIVENGGSSLTQISLAT